MIHSNSGTESKIRPGRNIKNQLESSHMTNLGSEMNSKDNRSHTTFLRDGQTAQFISWADLDKALNGLDASLVKLNNSADSLQARCDHLRSSAEVELLLTDVQNVMGEIWGTVRDKLDDGVRKAKQGYTELGAGENTLGVWEIVREAN